MFEGGSIRMGQTESVPTVSIGLPVFNGAQFLDSTLRSLRAQSFTDFEVLVGDNASTDATAAICAQHAAEDPRIRVERHPRNLGAGPNYDSTFHRARGRYFKWAAHDDKLAPDYLARCVTALRTTPGAVLCTTGIIEIGAQDGELRRYANRFPGIESADPARRLAAVIHTRHQCEDFFGLFRREALLGTGLHGTTTGSDRMLLAEMALRGPWVSVPQPVFLHREHAGRYTRALLLRDRRAAAAWQDSSGAAARASTLFHWTVYREYWRLVRRHVADPTTRRRCHLELLRWWRTDGHAADVLRDLLGAHAPGLLARARLAKRALLGGARPVPPGGLPHAE